ncbi:unnamed protein product [Cyclocybe aegerita]|uniref:Uncharacterized protein n=1 Tax=Cyclocybe aegerita TaxID=1973307 RepID=A0A8S0VUU8_CYCAE|nr:unnamed protein product [Cyclocybe aegerita]
MYDRPRMVTFSPMLHACNRTLILRSSSRVGREFLHAPSPVDSGQYDCATTENDRHDDPFFSSPDRHSSQKDRNIEGLLQVLTASDAVPPLAGVMHLDIVHE